jgi:hypothetical protein
VLDGHLILYCTIRHECTVHSKILTSDNPKPEDSIPMTGGFVGHNLCTGKIEHRSENSAWNRMLECDWTEGSQAVCRMERS